MYASTRAGYRLLFMGSSAGSATPNTHELFKALDADLPSSTEND
jgi:hypothetical protein